MGGLDQSELEPGQKRLTRPEYSTEESRRERRALQSEIGQPLAEGESVEENSLLILESPDKYDEATVRRAARIAAEEYPGMALEYAYKYKGQSWAEEVMEKAARKAAEKFPLVALVCADKYKEQPYAGEVIKIAAEKFPWGALEWADKYIEQPYAGEVMKIAAGKEPWTVLDYAYKYKDQPYAQEVLEEAAKYYPWRVGTIDKTTLIEIFGTEEKAEKFIKKYKNEAERADWYVDFPQHLLSLEEIDGLTEYMLIGALREYQISIPYGDFLGIFFALSFQMFLKEQAGKMHLVNAFSVVNSICRKLKKEEKTINDENVAEALKTIWDKWEKSKNREIFGPQTRLILFTHEEPRFSNEGILGKIYARSGGIQGNVLCSEKGVKMEDEKNTAKEKVLSAIKASKGPTTILFEGHGSSENWAFAKNTADDLDHSLKGTPRSINYRELGDALIESGNLEDINIVATTCHGYDYIENLFKYLEEKNVKEKPAVCISSANKDALGYGGGTVLDSILLEAVYEESQDGKPIQVEDFFKAEHRVWRKEDPSIKIGNEQIGYNTPSSSYEEIARNDKKEKPVTGT